jgi:hypothetical protein
MPNHTVGYHRLAVSTILPSEDMAVDSPGSPVLTGKKRSVTTDNGYGQESCFPTGEGEIIPPCVVIPNMSARKVLRIQTEQRCKMLDAEVEILWIREHASSIFIGRIYPQRLNVYSPELYSPAVDTVSMYLFTTLLKKCREDIYSMRCIKRRMRECPRDTRDNKELALSATFALLATRDKKSVSDYVKKQEKFSEICMVTSFQLIFHDTALKEYFFFYENVSTNREISEMKCFLGREISIPSIAIGLYAVEIDQLLWRCSYPEYHIMQAITQANRMAECCSYDFHNQIDLFRLYQNLVIYLCCLQIREKQGLDNHDSELQRVLGINHWLAVDSNRKDFVSLQQYWKTF